MYWTWRFFDNLWRWASIKALASFCFWASNNSMGIQIFKSLWSFLIHLPLSFQTWVLKLSVNHWLHILPFILLSQIPDSRLPLWISRKGPLKRLFKLKVLIILRFHSRQPFSWLMIIDIAPKRLIQFILIHHRGILLHSQFIFDISFIAVLYLWHLGLIRILLLQFSGAGRRVVPLKVFFYFILILVVLFRQFALILRLFSQMAKVSLFIFGLQNSWWSIVWPLIILHLSFNICFFYFIHLSSITSLPLYSQLLKRLFDLISRLFFLFLFDYGVRDNNQLIFQLIECFVQLFILLLLFKYSLFKMLLFLVHFLFEILFLLGKHILEDLRVIGCALLVLLR